MAAATSSPKRCSRPPLVRTAQSMFPPDRPDLELTLQFAALVRAHDASLAVIVDDAGAILAAVGPERDVASLSLFAAALAHGRPVGSARSFECGRVHVEVALLRGERHVVALKGDFLVREPSAVVAFVREAFARDVVEAEEAIVDAQDEDFDFEFDLAPPVAAAAS